MNFIDKAIAMNVQAIQWNGTWEDVPRVKAFTNGAASERSDLDGKRSYLWLKGVITSNGVTECLVPPRHWIVKDEFGGIRICHSDIFDVRYKTVK